MFLPWSVTLSLLPIVVYLAFRWKNRRFYRISSELPGPVDYPLIGCGHLFIGKSNEEQFAIINDITKTYPSPCRAWLGPKLFVFIDNPEDMQVILNSPNCLEKADVYRFFRCEKGLFSSPAGLWKVHRKLLAPCFSPAILASFVSIFNVKSEILVQRLRKNVDQEVFNLYGDISRCTLDMICATTLGTNMDLQSNEGTEFIKAIEDACELINSRIHKIWLHPEWIYQKTKFYREEKECYEKAYKMSHKILELKQGTRGKSKKATTSDDLDLKKPQIYIDQILRLAEETDVFDDRAIRDELDTIIVGGNETSALTLSHVMLMLAIHEEIQQKVYNEIVNVLGGRDPSIPVHNDHLSQLNYTEMVMKETMRLFPVGPVVARTCTAPTRISKTTIPEGTTVVLGVFNTHRNAKYWGPDVDSFNPDNFFPERVAERHPYSFLPFSGGPRNCIGYKYGLMSMKIMLCHLLRAYRFRSPLKMDQLQLKMSITLKIANKHMVQIVRIFLVSTLIASLAYYRWKHRKFIATLAKMNGPWSMPLLGHIHLLKDFTTEEKIFKNLYKYSNMYASPVAVQLGPLVHVFTYKPEHIQMVLNSQHCLDKPKQYEFLRVSRAIFSAPAELWKDQRKMFNPSFGPGILSSFVSIFNEKSAILTDMLSLHVGKAQQNISHEIILCALDTICCTAFGIDLDLQRSPLGAEYLDHQETYIQYVTQRVFAAQYYPNFIYRMTKVYQKEIEAFEGMQVLSRKVAQVLKIEEDLTKELPQPKKQEETGTKRAQMFVDKLLEAVQEGAIIKRADIIQHMLTIFFAGNDTTATTLNNLLLMLAMYPDVQERVYQEVMAVCPEKDQPVTIGDASKLTYTEMVCKETMRLFPVGPLIGRMARRDVKLDETFTIPAGTTVVSCIYKVHRDPEIWGPEADSFNPDNFLPDLVAKRHPYSYLPFSGGPRNCIGVRYAWLSMKIMIAHVLRRYRLRTSHTLDTLNVKYSIILKIADGCPVTLEER
ncbi:uncharacterized protein LOC135705214 [Ochlerotatus camptorhynchus]|uniref:uncharacterized protein LOC135705214 n=1 Tax=Ochlerotatus camptorhynchus TaxID=644619 RepID=UPI0031DD2469